MDKKETTKLILKCLVTLALLTFLVARVNIADSFRTILLAKINLTAFAFCLMSFNFFSSALNLNNIVKSIGKSGVYSESLKVTYVTQFFSFAGFGEVFASGVKFKYLDQICKTEPLVKTEKLSVLVYEKIVMVFATFLLTAISLLCFFSELGGHVASLSFGSSPRFFLSFTVAGILLFSLIVLKRVFQAHWDHIWVSLTKLMGDSGLLGRLLITNAFIYTNNILINYLVFRSLDVNVQLADIIFLYFFLFISQFLPISIGGLGVKENIAVYIMLLCQITPEQSVAYSMICLCLTMVHSSLGGVLYLLDHFKHVRGHASIASTGYSSPDNESQNRIFMRS